MSKLVDRLRRKATPQQEKAMRLLEQHGLRFLVHFGTDNAIEKYRAMKRAKRQLQFLEFLKAEGIVLK